MKHTVLIDRNGWILTSYGNGLSYNLTGPNGADLFVQGDDAIHFREVWESAEKAWPHRDNAAIMSYVYDQMTLS